MERRKRGTQLTTKLLGQSKTSLDLSTLVYGKVAPQARELEEAVLGAILLERKAFDVVAELLKPEAFYLDAHQSIFGAMRAMHLRGTPIDMLTVVNELQTSGKLDEIGGAYYIAKLTNAVVSTANLEAHAKILQQKFIARELIRISAEIMGDAYEHTTDVFDLVDKAEQEIFNIAQETYKEGVQAIINHAVKVFERIDTLRANRLRGINITGVPSGIPSVDDITYGWQQTDLIILAARPSVGKTAFALRIARNAVLHPVKPTKVGIFSLEMSATQLVSRIMSAESEINLNKILHGDLTDEETNILRVRTDLLLRSGLYIDDSAALSLYELRTKARRLVLESGVGLIIVDYLQLMQGDTNRSDNREREISKISRGLKQLGKELNIPVIALSQLSRKIEDRTNKEPTLADLRESGAIEQDADVVAFLYRPSDADIIQNPVLRDKGYIKFSKHRNGVLKETVLSFYGDIQKWCDVNERHFNLPGTLNVSTNKGFVPMEDIEDFTLPKSEKQ